LSPIHICVQTVKYKYEQSEFNQALVVIFPVQIKLYYSQISKF
jgi:hypothetical protein